MKPVDPDEALALIGGDFDPEGVGPFSGRSAVLLRVDRADAARRTARALRQLPCVVIGVDEEGDAPGGLEELDILLTPAPGPAAPWVGCTDDAVVVAQRLSECVARQPEAAVTLVQLLRLGEHLPVRDALVAESITYAMLQSGASFRAWLAAQPARTHRESREPAVLTERIGDELVIELNRPGVRNAYDVVMRDGLVAALSAANADPSIRAIHLRGAGPVFCSGGDLSEFGSTPDPVVGHLVRSTRSPAWWLAELGAKVTAHVHGACVGAGIEMPAFAGRVVAAPTATFALPEVSMGLIPGAGGTVSIPRRIGRQRAAFMSILGEPVDTDAARHWGLVDEIA